MRRQICILVASLVLAAPPAGAGERRALIRPDNTIERFADDIDPNVATKPGWKWLPAPPVTPPAFDRETQVREGPTFSVGAASVTESYSVRAKTAAELDADKDSKIDGIAEAVLRALCNHENRIRALKVPPDPSVTLAQCRTQLRGLLP